MTLPLIRNQAARRQTIALQGLAAPPRQRQSRADLLALIVRLGYVQVDSINTVERAHHQILFARNQNYKQRHLTHLIEREASLFENWTHDAAIIPARFYPYWHHRFGDERERLKARWRKWRRAGFEEKFDEVRRHIAERGPTMARHLEEKGGRESRPGKDGQGWWDWRPSKTALEYLWRTGELAVCRRQGFEKIYDLAERVIPDAHRNAPPSREAYLDWACRGALMRLGYATAGELAGFWGGLSAAETAEWCRRKLGDEVIEVRIEAANGDEPQRAFAAPDFPEQAETAPRPPGQLRVLSPFDPLLRNRTRTGRLFGFRYRIEVFVPEAKREFGYYVFPLLEGDRLVGRIDMKCERTDGVLSVRALWLEPRLRLTAVRRDKLEAELARIAAFVGVERVVFQDDFLRI